MNQQLLMKRYFHALRCNSLPLHLKINVLKINLCVKLKINLLYEISRIF